MAKESLQHTLDRVRAPRVQITYDVEIGEAIEMKEIPFVVGVLADISGKPDEPLPKLKDRKFEVLANQPVSFDIYSSSFRSGDQSGDLVEVDNSLTPLPPVRTIIQFGQKGVKTSIPIKVQADYTEIGSLALWCKSLVSNHRWQMQFQLRDVSILPDVEDEEVFD